VRRLSVLSLYTSNLSHTQYLFLNSVSYEEAVDKTMASSLRLAASAAATCHLFSFPPLATPFLFYLIVGWAHCTLVSDQFGKTTHFSPKKDGGVLELARVERNSIYCRVV